MKDMTPQEKLAARCGELTDLCWRIIRDAVPATDSGQTCFVPKYQLEKLAAYLSQLGAMIEARDVFRIAGGDVECEPNPSAESALACLRQLRESYDESLSEHGGGGEAEYEFEVWQDDSMQAGGSTTDYATAKSEADHYALMYGQDGPVEIRLYEKRRITTPPTPSAPEVVYAVPTDDETWEHHATPPPNCDYEKLYRTPSAPDPKGLGAGGRYWRERAEFWRAQAVALALGWREVRDAANGEAPSAPFRGLDSQGKPIYKDPPAVTLTATDYTTPSAPVVYKLLRDLRMIAEQGEMPDGDGAPVNVSLWAEKHVAALSGVSAPVGVEEIVEAIVRDPFNETDTETLRRCVASALTPAAAPRGDAFELCDECLRLDRLCDKHAHLPGTLESFIADQKPAASEDGNRKAAEQAYTVTAFDYERAPVGSRDWTLFWKGWQESRRLAASGQGADAKDAARYRWMKQWDVGIDHEGGSVWRWRAYAEGSVLEPGLDAVVDAAMKEQA